MDRVQRTPEKREDAQDTCTKDQCYIIIQYWPLLALVIDLLVVAHSLLTLALMALSSGCQNPTRVSPLNSPLHQWAILALHRATTMADVAVSSESGLLCVDVEDPAILCASTSTNKE